MFDISQTFTVEIQGRGSVRLGPNDHVVSGGEGHIYRTRVARGGRGGGPAGGTANLAIKIWDEPDHADRHRMPDRIRLLAELKHGWIVAPESLVLDGNGKIIGYAMPWVEGWDLPQAFTNDWRMANGFGDGDALAFAGKMRQVTQFVHGKGVIMGDANELNILGVGREPRYIDVDPWILPGFTSDKVLPTIRDWNGQPFTQEADWFAWGVVTFQLLTGIHPYRGTHPDFKRTDIEGRMKANASVFGPAVRLPPAARPFTCIPGPLLDWYRAAFGNGERSVPPDPSAIPSLIRAAGARTVRRAGANLTVTERYALPAAVLRAVAPDILMLQGGLLVSLPDGRAYGSASPDAAFARLIDGATGAIQARDGALLFGAMHASPGGGLAMQDAGIAANAVWSAENRMFAITHDGLLEVQVRDVGARHVALPGRKWAMNPKSTAFGDGVALYDALGAKFLIAPFGQQGVAVLRCRDLDGLKPVSMRRRGRVGVMSLIDRSGAYRRAVIVFSEDFSACQVELSDADDGNLSDVITDSGVIVRFSHDGKLELRMPATGAQREADPGSLIEGTLLAGPSGVFCAEGGKVYKLSLS